MRKRKIVTAEQSEREKIEGIESVEEGEKTFKSEQIDVVNASLPLALSSLKGIALSHLGKLRDKLEAR